MELEAKKPIVLVVEDVPTLRQVEGRMLKELGVEHSLAQDAREALEVLEQNPGRFSHVFSDFDMPGMSGGEFAELIREKDSDISITLMTGRASDDESLNGLREKGINFVQKPFTLPEVEKLLTIEGKDK